MPSHLELRQRSLLSVHLIVIALSIWLVGIITYDCLSNISFISSEGYLRTQLWICLLFEAAIIAEIFLRGKMTAWEWATHIIFMIICVPYLSIFDRYGVHMSPQWSFIFRFIPMVRAVYALGIVSGAMSKSWIKGLFFSYLMILVLSLYFGSLMFYIEEHYVNSAVTDYWSALYWAGMDVTTCGSAINAITPTGKVLAVVLAAEGLMLYPVFTVYVTDAVTHASSGSDDDASQTSDTANDAQQAASSAPAPSAKA